MRLIDLIKHKIDQPSVCAITSKAAVGKTTLQTILAVELVKQGKNVLFLSSDEHPKYLIARFSKIIDITDPTLGKLIISRFYKNLEIEISSRVKEENIDYLFIDDIMFGSDKMINFFKRLNISVFINFQLPRIINNSNLNGSTVNVKSIVNSVDSILLIERKETYTIFETIKYVFCFWKPKPNITIKYLKNRDSETLDTLISINFENLTFNL